MPDFLRFLDQSLFLDEAPYAQDLNIAVDIGNWDRLESREEVFRTAPASVCIDHHLPNGVFCSPCLVEPDAAAAGLLVYSLVRALERDTLRDPAGWGLDAPVKLMDKSIADALYTAILTDTGGFKYDSTGSESFYTAAALVECGADYSGIAANVFDSKPLAQLKVDALALERARFAADGKAVISYITLKDLEELDALPEYCENCINVLRSIEGVEVAALLKEREPDFFKLSLRAKSWADVRSIAMQFEGGGHLRAAGGQLNMPLEGACKAVERAIDAYFAAFG